jgi:hypothetical protein
MLQMTSERVKKASVFSTLNTGCIPFFDKKAGLNEAGPGGNHKGLVLWCQTRDWSRDGACRGCHGQNLPNL